MKKLLAAAFLFLGIMLMGEERIKPFDEVQTEFISEAVKELSASSEMLNGFIPEFEKLMLEKKFDAEDQKSLQEIIKRIPEDFSKKFKTSLSEIARYKTLPFLMRLRAKDLSGNSEKMTKAVLKLKPLADAAKIDKKLLEKSRKDFYEFKKVVIRYLKNVNFFAINLQKHLPADASEKVTRQNEFEKMQKNDRNYTELYVSVHGKSGKTFEYNQPIICSSVSEAEYMKGEIEFRQVKKLNAWALNVTGEEKIQDLVFYCRIQSF